MIRKNNEKPFPPGDRPGPVPASLSPTSFSFAPDRPGRIVEIDIAKGMACLLMIAAHFISAGLLPFGTFAAPLFFACSGMNTILLIARTRGNRRYDLFHVIFPVLLFFGGSTQTVIALGGRLRIAPGFLQCIALAVLALFLLSRAFREPMKVGHLFPLPFLVQQLLPLSFLKSSPGTPLAFLVGSGFVLFPWLGFFLFGVFILRLQRGRFLPLTLLLGAGAGLALGLESGAPRKFWMSPSFIFLALLAVSLAFVLARRIAAGAGRAFSRGLAGFFALPGRNALMFLYLHYFVLRYFVSVDFFPHYSLYLLFTTLYLFYACWVLLLLYEKVKHETSLLFPAFSLMLALGTLRWLVGLKPRGGPPMVDLAIGILFAFLYVLLRRRAAAWSLRRQESA